jgi:cytochrome c-type biogenesis protein CcmH
MKRLLLIALFCAAPAWAVQPDEILSDPALEARARAISEGLRCPVCQNENIDASDAPIARDLRILLRERIVAGDTDAQATDFLVARYGEFILLTPTVTGINMILWLAAPGMLLAALAVGWVSLRRRATAPEPALSDAERAAVRKIMRS